MDSDADHPLEPVTSHQWLDFEREVANLIAGLDPNATVEHNVTLTGELSRTRRQVDVLVRGTLAGQAITIAIECKRYAKPLGIGAVDEFAGKIQDLGVDRGVLFALNGLTGPAKQRAAGAAVPRISIGDLTKTPALPPTELEHLFKGFGDCPNTNCYTGDIHWRDWEDEGQVVQAGSCYACGTWAALCPECEEVVMFVSSEETSWCGQAIELQYDRDGAEVEMVTARPGSAATTDATE